MATKMVEIPQEEYDELCDRIDAVSERLARLTDQLLALIPVADAIKKSAERLAPAADLKSQQDSG